MSIADELRALDDEQRLRRIEEILHDSSAAPEDKAVACNRAAFDCWKIGRMLDAVAYADLGLTYTTTPVVVARLQVLKAMSHLDSGDPETALQVVAADLDPDILVGVRAEWVGVRARALALRNDAQSFGLFREAITLFTQANRPENVGAMQINAAILAISLGQAELATTVLNELTHEPFLPERDILRAQIQQESGDFISALAAIEAVWQTYAGAMDLNDEARAYYVSAMAYQGVGQADRSAHLLEKAASKAYYAKPLDLDLIRRIQQVRQVA